MFYFVKFCAVVDLWCCSLAHARREVWSGEKPVCGK